MKKTNTSLIIFGVLATIVIIALFWLIRNKRYASFNIHNMRYVKISEMNQAISNGNGPNSEKTFLMTLSRNSCSTCQKYKKIMKQYVVNTKGKSGKDGYVAYYTTNTDVEKPIDIQNFIKNHMYNKKYITWSNQKEKKELKQFSTPTTYFVKNGQLIDIIVGLATNEKQIVNYVLSKK